jgi:hypothetical protein
MSFTMTRTATESFTLTHAKYLSSKVTSDMVRCQQLYGQPYVSEINNYGTELALLLRDNYVSAYEFGFTRDGVRLLSWYYQVDRSGNLTSDDRPGRIVSGVNVAGATFFNFLNPSATWDSLSIAERERFEKYSPINRSPGQAPQDGNGYWVSDLGYSSAGVGMARKTFRPY